MSIKQTRICDGCEDEIRAENADRMKVNISNIPTNSKNTSGPVDRQSVVAVKDVCSAGCALHVMTKLLDDAVRCHQGQSRRGSPSSPAMLLDLDSNVDDCEFSVRLCHWLQNHKVTTVRQLSEFDFQTLPYGHKPNKRMFKEIDEALARYGLVRCS